MYVHINVKKTGKLPGLSGEHSGKEFGLYGLHAATKIRSRITRAPKAIAKMATLEIEAAFT